MNTDRFSDMSYFLEQVLLSSHYQNEVKFIFSGLEYDFQIYDFEQLAILFGCYRNSPVTLESFKRYLRGAVNQGYFTKDGSRYWFQKHLPHYNNQKNTVWLYVSDLPNDVDSQQLLHLFSTYNVVNETPIISKNTSSNSCYTFLRFASVNDAEHARKAYNLRFINRRPIKVRYAFKKDEEGEVQRGLTQMHSQNPLFQKKRPNEMCSTALGGRSAFGGVGVSTAMIAQMAGLGVPAAMNYQVGSMGGTPMPPPPSLVPPTPGMTPRPPPPPSGAGWGAPPPPPHTPGMPTLPPPPPSRGYGGIPPPLPAGSVAPPLPPSHYGGPGVTPPPPGFGSAGPGQFLSLSLPSRTTMPPGSFPANP